AFGKYKILEKLGRGGKGIVFKVWDTLEDRAKAVKIVPPQIADSPVAFKELKREVNNASGIIHANVVKVMGLEKHEGQYFIVMEYIEGRSLEEMLAQSKDGRLKESDVIPIIKKLAQGLYETHKKNVIHRDIKPANIMVTPGGQVKILDYGVSYQVTKSMTQLVGEDQTTGTWPYMAPEQLSNRFGRENKQVDVWGLGATMYQLLAGELPFRDKALIKDKSEKPYELVGVSPKTRAIVMKCLEKDRKKRFHGMEEVIKALDDLNKKEEKGISGRKWMLLGVPLIILIITLGFIFIKPGEKMLADVRAVKSKGIKV
ncbi:MAG: serine/threonine protein kinase, partial [bacterium]|nr:serine/threonine protein kinase [bacterium]